MKKILLTLSLFAFTAAFAAPLLTTAPASAAKCKKGYTDDGYGHCVRKTRGSHG